MRFGRWLTWFGLAAIISLAMGSGGEAQTLREKLLAEDPAELAHLARQDGDIVRGAILFHQGNINCAKCHRPKSEQDRIGPDLSRIEKEVTDVFLIESILQPSKTIKEGYESTLVLTVDGETIDGLKIQENDVELVIRDRQDVDRLHTIAKEDIDGMRAGTLSSMPDDLADELKNRQQFLDLLRYVIDVKERGPDASAQAIEPVTRRELSRELNGLVLTQKLNCVACHGTESISFPVTAKQAPNLEWSAKHLNPNYLEAFIASPHQVKPGTTMPELFGQMSADERKRTATSITHYLIDRAQNEYSAQPIDSSAVPRGHELFHSIGCVACHAPRDASGDQTIASDSTPLGNLSQKYSLHSLTEFLEDPQAVRPSGHMPNMQLTRREAIDLSNFLLQKAEDPGPEWKVDVDLAAMGKTHFGSLQCANCHTESRDRSVELAMGGDLGRVDLRSGCLSAESGMWPNFRLNASQRDSIFAALVDPPQLNKTEQIDVSLKTFNCLACHERDRLGGVTPDRNPHFQTTDLNLGDQGRIPPALSGIGAKLNPKWTRDVLVNRREIRPYMKTRMPQFGEENVGHLVDLFEAVDELPDTKFAEFQDQKKMRETGLELAGNRGLNCIACHTYKYKLSDTMPAVDLTEMAERLKKDWFYQYMLAPQKFSPNTVMPSFWPGGRAIRTDLEGDPHEQIEAIWQYLIDGRQANTPRGVVREPLEIVVTDEARMLRRSYPEVGKRGIGVGYPGGVNIVFDAEQLRLASLWRGKFVDPSGVWRGQGSGQVRPMSRPIHFAKGPDLSDSNVEVPRDVGRPPDFRFKGYELDGNRRPTFRYQDDSVKVEEFFTEVIDEEQNSTRLKRTIKLSASGEHEIDFRIASAARIVANDDQNFQVGENLIVKVVSDHDAVINATEEGQVAKVLLPLEDGRDQTLVIEYSWK